MLELWRDGQPTLEPFEEIWEPLTGIRTPTMWAMRGPEDIMTRDTRASSSVRLVAHRVTVERSMAYGVGQGFQHALNLSLASEADLVLQLSRAPTIPTMPRRCLASWIGTTGTARMRTWIWTWLVRRSHKRRWVSNDPATDLPLSTCPSGTRSRLPLPCPFRPFRAVE